MITFLVGSLPVTSQKFYDSKQEFEFWNYFFGR